MHRRVLSPLSPAGSAVPAPEERLRIRPWRRLAALALLVVLATQAAGCAADPEVVRANRWALAHPHAFDD
jgi:hypothetical protein